MIVRFLLAWALSLPGLVWCSQDNLSQTFAAERAARVSRVSYDLELRFHKAATNYQGTVKIEFQLRDRADDLIVDFANRSIGQLLCNGQAVGIDYRADLGRLVVPKTHLKVGSNHLEIDFSADYANDGEGLHHFTDPGDGLEYMFTDLEPHKAHRVFPCFDQPDLRARFNLQVLMPPSWEISANGAMVSSRLHEGRKLVSFKQTQPIATFLFNVTLGAYAVFYNHLQDIPMRLLCRQSQAMYMDSDLIFWLTEKGLIFFVEYFGQAYPFGKYDQVFVPEYNQGAMENPGSVVYNEVFVVGFDPGAEMLLNLEKVLLHEMAHMWFGNLVTVKWWDDLWLSESFASYMEIVALRGMGREKTWQIAAKDKAAGYRRDQTRATHPVVMPVPDVRQAAASFDTITYNKGLGLVRQLEFHLGEAVFRKGIRRYLQRHAWSNTTRNDFFEALAPFSDLDLKAWQERWLFTSGTNRVSLTWQADAKTLQEVAMHQQPGSGDRVLRPHSMLVGLFYADENGNAALRQTVRVSIDGATTPLPHLKGMDKPLFLLPNPHENAFVLVDLDPRSLDWVRQNLALVESEAIRFRLWDILWNMMCEGRFPASDWIALAMDQMARAEDEEARFLLDYLRVLANEYLVDDAFSKRLFAIAREGLENSANSEAFRITCLETLMVLGADAQQLAYLNALFTGSALLSGLDLVGPLRWPILAALVEVGYTVAEHGLKKLKEEAPVEMVELFEPFILALRPTRDSKEEAWRQIADQRNSLQNRRMWMSGFSSRRQASLLKAYTTRYFQALSDFYDAESWNFLEAFADAAFPRWDPQACLVAADAFLAQTKHPQPLRNLVLQLVDELAERTQVKQAHDRTKK